ncbi:CoA transferase [Sphingobium sp. JS3065]|uniref:CaiB/BaiF CoA transferase family protein n=1 Tax=Sphingobium sp. JS3065 TaxID=2970925 RepID=UPI0022650148|nr:CoA transferase [Sphingobium sp. JS3065]UZW56394.1 CoA transferase [Sphingobium sp. JS3065]
MTERADQDRATQPPIARKMFDPDIAGPLHGVRVLDLSRLVAGNLLTKMLADHGAEVVKVEPPAGDTLRAWKVEGVSTAWKTWGRNKKSVAINLRDPEAVDLILSLAATSAIFVESFKPGTLEKMGLAPERLLAVNPRLVIVRISGWGQDGAYRHKPGFGTLVEGYSGFADVNGYADRPPVLPPMFMADAYAGLYGATAAMIALRVVEESGGLGQVIDLSLLDPLFSIMEPQIANYRLTRSLKPRTGSRSGNTAPRNAYRTKDGHWVALSASTSGMTEKLFRSMGREDLIGDPRFADNAARLCHVEELDAIISDFIGQRDREVVLSMFDRAGVTIGPIMNAEDLERDSYIIERESLIEVPDEEMGWLPMHGQVARLSRTPAVLARPAPRKGEHNQEILRPLVGDRYTDLVRQNVIVEGDG